MFLANGSRYNAAEIRTGVESAPFEQCQNEGISVDDNIDRRNGV